ncbi:3102_t:CDS:2 [Ambispora gerdemannii]|uniref:3102_t:CDS:1 n=1 Tax=Ambispora gerdemannii TaxID=144530 RepID=A0A9N9GNI4_9GLOM|nr:3102_t:CDS:2 [Ambispora gerdemannii]
MNKKRKRNSSFKETIEPSVEFLRELSQKRLKSAWDDIIARYGCDLTEETDEIDLMTGEVVVDRGVLKNAPVFKIGMLSKEFVTVDRKSIYKHGKKELGRIWTIIAR